MNLASTQDLAELEKAFKAINVSNSGKITKDELYAGFNAQTYEEFEEVDQIFAEVDLDGNGDIEFSEWIVASIDK